MLHELILGASSGARNVINLRLISIGSHPPGRALGRCLRGQLDLKLARHPSMEPAAVYFTLGRKVVLVVIVARRLYVYSTDHLQMLRSSRGLHRVTRSLFRLGQILKLLGSLVLIRDLATNICTG